MWDGGLEPVEAIVQRQKGMPPEGNDHAFSSGVRTVERGSFGPIWASAVVDRLRHFWTVVGLTP